MCRVGLVIGLAAAILTGALASGAAAHSDHLDESGQELDGRQPGQPDFRRIEGTTYRYRPAIDQYEIRKEGQPPSFAHYDAVAAGGSANAGPNTPLPESQQPPRCRTSGHRVVVVHTHRPSEPAADAAMTETLRKIVRQIASKIYYQSIASGSGKRNAELVVDCNGSGQINVYDVVASSWGYSELFSTVTKALGEYTGSNAVKYLVFDHKDQGGGVGSLMHDTSKNQGNWSATYTGVAIAYRQVWGTHVPIHELFHNFGASQGDEPDPPPFSSYEGHCVDGLDVLCYDDGSYSKWGSFTETRCPASEGYAEAWKVPIDCKYDTYFDTVPTEGAWLAKYWDSGGAENPFLVFPPKATTESATQKPGEHKATLSGTVDPDSTNTTYYFEYGTEKSYGSKVPVAGGTASAYSAKPVSVNATIGGLTNTTTYHYRLVATNEWGTSYGEDKTFITSYAPKVTLKGVEFFVEKETGKGIIRGTINPTGFATSYHFIWGEKGQPGVQGAEVGIGSGETDIAVEQKIEGLKGGTQYTFSLVAKNENGEKSATSNLNSPPWRPVASAQVLSLGSASATLGATINPEGFGTTYHFEWGVDEKYGNSIPVPEGNVGSGQSGVEVSQTIEGLSPSTRYYYRLSAVNKNGQTSTYGGNFLSQSEVEFSADYYPVELHSVGDPLQLKSTLFSLSCAPPVFAGTLGGPSPTIGATGYAGQYCGSHAIEMHDCELAFAPGDVVEDQSVGTVSIGPPGCGPITIAYTYNYYNCPIQIGPQQISPVAFKNEGVGNEARVAIDLDSSASIPYSLGGVCGPFFPGLKLAWEGGWEVSGRYPQSEAPFGLRMGDTSP
jgi:hypothetical protein